MTPPITVTTLLSTRSATESPSAMSERTIPATLTQTKILRAGTSLSFVLSGSSARVGRRCVRYAGSGLVEDVYGARCILLGFDAGESTLNVNETLLVLIPRLLVFSRVMAEDLDSSRLWGCQSVSWDFSFVLETDPQRGTPFS